MKKRIFAFLLALLAALSLLSGCGAEDVLSTAADAAEIIAALTEEAEATAPPETPAPTPAATPAPATEPPAPETATPVPETAAPQTTAPVPETEAPAAVAEDGEYTAPEDVAEYLHLYGHLPGNFITKKEAQALGWPGGDLWRYAPGKSIGGDRFGNYEGLLPKGSYHECDVNYAGGSRGAERIIYDDAGGVWYTDDHYASFTKLY